jgi:DNA invertase Pin-like site-specific DNA recombinase
MKKAAIYARVSTYEQNPQMQLNDLRQLAAQRGLVITKEYVDHISGTRARRAGLDDLLRDARRGGFEVLLVWATDRLARSVKHFLEVLDELERLNIEFVSYRENLDTGGPLGRAVVTIVSVVAELERNLIVERVKSGMRRAKLEGRHIGRRPLAIDRASVLRHREAGRSLAQIAKAFTISRTTAARIIAEEKQQALGVPQGVPNTSSQLVENRPTESAA